jgi:uncharacterized membrane protein YdjX (TVP38/TMEM64 family)
MDRHWKAAGRLAGLVVLVAAGALAWHSGAVRILSWPSLVAHRDGWVADAAAHPVLAPLIFAGIYALTVAVFLPVGIWLSLLGGLLFGMWLGTLYTAIGAGSGAVAAFLLARGLLAPFFAARLGGRVARLRDGLARDGFSYLLALRLMPVFPFWLVTLAPALLGMRVAPFASATLLGLLPASLVLNAVGAGLGATLASGAPPKMAMLLRPDVLLPLAALAVLALLPPLWRAWRRGTRRAAKPKANSA